MKHLNVFIISALLGSVSNAALMDDFFLGVESGGILKHSTSSIEDSGQGLELGVKLLTTRPWRGWDVDLGGGYRFNQLTEERVTVKTRSFFAETAVREKLTSRLSVGPMLSALIGQDVSFSDFGTNSDNKTFSLFAGAKALYEVPLRSTEGRIGMQVQTDLNIGSRQITQIQVVAEFAWPFSKKQSLAQAAPEKKSPRKTTYNLMKSGLRFDLDSNRLSKDSKNFLEEIAGELKKSPESWSYVSVAGHSDSQGSYVYNLKLSKKRAQSVKQVFESAGLTNDRIFTSGHGSKSPIDYRDLPEAHAKNRRVELTIHNLKSNGALAKKLSRILK